MAYIRKSINIISPADGKHYDSLAKYEKSLESKGQFIMTDGDVRKMKEKIEQSANKSKPKDFNHVHIDLNNDRIIKSKREDI